jgi:spore coat polysaccharide biosynthesis predicted glycosyltransferase SpsG
LKQRSWKRETSRDARKVLITLGGSDPLNATHRVIKALVHLPLELKVVLGGDSPHIQVIQQLAGESGGENAQMELVVNPGDMPALMMWADLAIAAGGSTVWEMAFLGLPAIFLLLAENQSANCDAVEAIGFGRVFRPRGETADFKQLATILSNIRNDPEQRHQLSVKCRQTVDGLGPHRVTKLLCQI